MKKRRNFSKRGGETRENGCNFQVKAGKNGRGGKVVPLRTESLDSNRKKIAILRCK